MLALRNKNNNMIMYLYVCTYVHVSDFACMVARSATYIYMYVYNVFIS